jgi:hypothetical protein
MAARRYSSLDHVERSSSLAHRAMTPQLRRRADVLARANSWAPGKQCATTAGELDETMAARRDSSLDNVEHSSSLAHRAMTPQYADALMCSHEQTGWRFRHLRDARQSCSANQPRMLLAASLAAPVPGHSVAALEQLLASPCPQLTSYCVPSH